MKEETDAILKAFGDILLQLGCDTGWFVPNTALNARLLNSSIAAYQQLLDGMELELSQALYNARLRDLKPDPDPVAEPLDVKSEPVSPQELGEAAQSGDTKANFDTLDSKFGGALNNDFGDEIDFYDMNSTDNLGLFGGASGMADDSKIDDGYGMIDDQYF